MSRSTYVANDLDFKRLSSNVSSGKSKFRRVLNYFVGVIGGSNLSPKV